MDCHDAQRSARFAFLHPHDPGLSETRDPVSRHHHAVGQRARIPARGRRAGEPWAGSKIDKVAGIEARGFIIGGAVAHQVSAGFVPIRKKGKLPYDTVRVAYSLEYGIDEMEMHKDGVARGERVILVDDLIATGGTAEGAVKLLRNIGAEVLAACFIVDLPDLGGADKIRKLGVPVRTLVGFSGH